MGYAGQNARFGQIAENAGMEGHRARTAAGKREPDLPPGKRVPGHTAFPANQLSSDSPTINIKAGNPSSSKAAAKSARRRTSSPLGREEWPRGWLCHSPTY